MNAKKQHKAPKPGANRGQKLPGVRGADYLRPIQGFNPPEFSVSELVGDGPARQYLHREGYVVLKQIVSPDQQSTAKALAWDFLEQLGSGISRTDPSTWVDSKWPDRLDKGLVPFYHVGQCSFQWFLRTLPAVVEAFAALWDTDALLTSFDGCSVMRPSAHDPTWRTAEGWWHFDQNGCVLPDMECVQGAVNCTEATDHTGGLVLLPRSHLAFKRFFELYHTQYAHHSHFIMPKKEQHYADLIALCGNSQPIKINCSAGALVLWDSRTLHCNSPALSASGAAPAAGAAVSLERVLAFVCMMPLHKIPRSEQENVVQRRMNAYHCGDTTSHWPTFFEALPTVSPKHPIQWRNHYEPVPLTDTMRALITGTPARPTLAPSGAGAGAASSAAAAALT